MKHIPVVSMAAAFALVSAVAPMGARAATINWAMGNMDGSGGVGYTAVSTAGTLVEAANFGGAAVPNVTVNSVPFTGVDFPGGGAPTHLTGLPYDTAESGLGTSTGSQIDVLTDTIVYQSGVDPQTATLTGLTPGKSYEAQFFLSHTGVSRTLTLSAANAVTITTRDSAQFATGTFTADAPTQAITLDANTGSQFLNAYQLREVPAPAPPPAPTALFDFRSGNVQAGWAQVDNAGNGTSGPVSLSTTTVGTSLDNRDRGSGNGGGAESNMWRDFLFANGSNALGEGLDLNLIGLAANTTYPVRIWTFDDSSNNGRGATWNGVLSSFPNGPDPSNLGDYVAKLNITTDGTGAATIQGRVYAANGQPHHVFVNGLEIGAPLAAAPTPPAFAIDIDSQSLSSSDHTGPIATAPGFTSLDATMPSEGKAVTVNGTTFTVFSSGGSRVRTTGGIPLPNELTADLVYDDGSNAAVGLQISNLPDGWYQAKVWAHDQTSPAGNQIVGITQPGGETILTTSFASNATEPFTFVFNSSMKPDNFGIFTRENTNGRSRMNALTLTPIKSPLPADPVWQLDIDIEGSPTAPGWTSIPVSGAAGEVVTPHGIRFNVFSADGSRDRAGPNDLTRDFVFDDGAGQAVGLQLWGLPPGTYEAQVWAWDETASAGDQIVGITQFGAGPEIIFTNDFTPSPTEPFTFTFNTAGLPDGFGIFTRENNDNNRARFNALRLTLIPEPATLLLTVLAIGGLGPFVRRRARRG